MITNKAICSSEEFSRRGKEIYARDVRPALRADDEDKFVAIDIWSGAYELDKDDYAATERLLAKQPDAQICWLVSASKPRTESAEHSEALDDHRNRQRSL